MANAKSPEFLVSEAQLILTDVCFWCNYFLRVLSTDLKARRQKSERTMNLGEPFQLPGKALAIQVHKGYVWVAENTSVARKIDLKTGNTLQIYKGHTGPVTSLVFFDSDSTSSQRNILITGSWDKTIKLWDTNTKALISSTEAHSDFVKCLFVFPSLRLLVSGGSDKIVRFWDLSDPMSSKPLSSLGSISSHTRPLSCIDGVSLSETTAILYTADSMGVIKIWDLVKESGEAPRWKSTLKTELTHHRTGIFDLRLSQDQLWTASADETVQLIAGSNTKPTISITHPTAVRCILPLTDLNEPYVITGAGDVIRVYDISSPEKPEPIKEVDAHWHDVTALQLWIRQIGTDSKARAEPWVVSTSLDGTVRKWRLDGLSSQPLEVARPPSAAKASDKFEMTEEEERELAELLDDD
ncbi:WD40-repeat-containing domain protein [Mycena pura]|uniref:WD40-repeat-containing domain protein n=1 Tax=Mycena pura TaxID=153505 RepID=A0AAD6V1I1_9AGAR|nr:WD40-repeat-containing domain protein [Mycena pura]